MNSRRRAIRYFSRVSFCSKRSMFVVGQFKVKLVAKYSSVMKDCSRVQMNGTKKKAIMTLTTRPTEVPHIRRDILGHHFNSKRDAEYEIFKLRTGKLIALSLVIEELFKL